MIQQLQLTNFQAHRSLILDLDHPVTTIIGPTDRGKSAIYRALKWIALNLPAGNNFLRQGSSSVSACLTVDDKTVERSAEGSGNLYTLEAKEYKAFGRAVPEDIQKFLQLSELNFQGQHGTADEPLPFWFALSPAEVSRQLNQIVNLELIDQTLSKLDSMIRAGRTIAAEREERLSEAQETYRKLRYVPEMEDDLKEVQTLEESWEDLQSKSEALGQLLAKAEESQAVVSAATQVCSEFGALLNSGKKMKELIEERNDLEKLLKEADRLQSQASVEVPDPSYLEKLALSAGELSRRGQGLATLLGQIEQAEKGLAGFRDRLAKAEAELKAFNKGKCPLCGNAMT